MLSFPPIADPVINLLDSHARHFSKLVGWATVVVAIGVALEGVEIVHDAVAWARRRRRKKRHCAALKELADIFPCEDGRGETESHADHPKWIKRLLRIGLIAVVAGAVGEWRFGSILEDAHNDVHTYDISKLLAADEKGG